MPRTESDCWYFAYGSNLFPRRKVRRTGPIRRKLRCRLPGYRLAFNKRGSAGDVKANIVPDAESEVWGVIYLCSPLAMEKLDWEEGVHDGHYRRIQVEVLTEQEKAVSAVTYQATEQWTCAEERPCPSYAQLVIAGAEHHGLPPEYIQQLRRLAGWDC